MPDVIMRPATLDDVQGIHEIYRCDKDPSPWSRSDECIIMVNHRLLTGIVVLVAEHSGRIVGHADYVLSQEPEPFGKTIHLSVLQVHSDFRRRGIGRLLIEWGAKLGREKACSMLTTQPADEAKGFYKACGFQCILDQVEALVRIDGIHWNGWHEVDRVPHEAVSRLPMRMGRVQSSEDMWHMCNFGVRIAGPMHPAARLADGTTFVQLRYVNGNHDKPLVVSWADRHVALEDLVSTAGTLAQRRGSTSLSCVIPACDSALLVTAGFDMVETGRVEFWALSL